MDEKTTLVMGASTNPDRYSNLAIHMLREFDQPVQAFGLREGMVEDVQIRKEREAIDAEGVETITLYLNPLRQREYYDWILSIQPKRVIFNPGTENPELMEMLKEAKIESVIACTLVMLRTGQYDIRQKA